MLVHKIKNIDELNAKFEGAKPQEIVNWAVKEFAPKIAMTSSFGPESGTLLHMVAQADPATPVLFLQTGYHFPETIAHRDALIKKIGLTNVVNLQADQEKKAELVARTEGLPYEQDPDECCRINKVEPLEKVIKDYDAWMSGIRRHQTDFRKSIQIIEEYEGEHYKISPLANFTSRDAWWYMKEHDLPQHPLWEKGYLSIGCWPCTRPIQAGDDERSGRWAGKSKKECGIHTFMKEVKPASDNEKDDSKDLGGGV